MREKRIDNRPARRVFGRRDQSYYHGDGIGAAGPGGVEFC
jgi:hypothetical protein